MLHSGHVRFLEEAATLGEVFVGIGSDKTVHELKGRYPVNSQEERRYMLLALKHVRDCCVNRGSGILDFENELREMRPDILVVNGDGNTPAKKHLCESLGIRYVVLDRIPKENLPARSTTSLRKDCRIPYRLDLAGGWLDQPFVSKFHPGPVLTISVEPLMEFNMRSGMASSTRNRAIELWQTDLPTGDREKLGRVLFAYENPPGTREFSGSQDALGIVMPGLNRLDYAGEYWPHRITTVQDPEVLSWLETRLHFLTLGPRHSQFNVLEGTHIDTDGARALAQAANDCWDAVLRRNLPEFGDAFRRSFEAQIRMFPNMVTPEIMTVLDQHREQALGWKLSGAGGGGYLVLVSENPIPETIQIKIRRDLF
jgi:cytidyltransferase-like protein